MLLVLLVGAWLLQAVLSYWQARRFYSRLSTLRRKGPCAVGQAGSKYRGKVFTVLAVDEAGIILNAERLSGLTVFARLQPVARLVGLPVSDLLSDRIEGLRPKLHTAFRQAAESLLAPAETETPAEGSEASVVVPDVSPIADA